MWAYIPVGTHIGRSVHDPFYVLVTISLGLCGVDVLGESCVTGAANDPHSRTLI